MCINNQTQALAVNHIYGKNNQLQYMTYFGTFVDILETSHNCSRQLRPNVYNNNQHVN